MTDLTAQGGVIFPVWMLIITFLLIIGICAFVHFKNNKKEKGTKVLSIDETGKPVIKIGKKED